MGGAAKAAYRLHSCLREQGVDSQMAVLDKQSQDATVQILSSGGKTSGLAQRLLRRLGLISRADVRHGYTYNVDLGRCSSAELGRLAQPDIICLHWITNFLDTRSILRLQRRFACPIVWLVLDQEPMTGGCHYSFDCKGYTRSCGNCPQLAYPGEQDWSRVVWRRKQQRLSGLPLTFIAPTDWVHQRIRASSLFGAFPVKRIALPVDTRIFNPGNRTESRAGLGLPPDAKVLFFGSFDLQDPRKGMRHLIQALDVLKAKIAASVGGVKAEDVLLLVAGNNNKELMRQLPFRAKSLGFIPNDAALATAYRAADVFICPSVEDAGPMMIPEAMLSGTPVAAFDTGGAPDLVRTMVNGYRAALGDANDLAQGMWQLLTTPGASHRRDAAAEDAMRLNAYDVVANEYVKLFQQMV